MIDLHIHSNFSDGAYSVDEILEIAQKIGCTTISIVDHNTCEAYEYLKNMKNRIFEGNRISNEAYCRCMLSSVWSTGGILYGGKN